MRPLKIKYINKKQVQLQTKLQKRHQTFSKKNIRRKQRKQTNTFGLAEALFKRLPQKKNEPYKKYLPDVPQVLTVKCPTFSPFEKN